MVSFEVSEHSLFNQTKHGRTNDGSRFSMEDVYQPRENAHYYVLTHLGFNFGKPVSANALPSASRLWKHETF